jgi:hypothetical protein
VITKPEEHDIDRAGKRLLRAALEKLGWILNDVEEDYGIDSNVQIFDGVHPTGAWFHVQLRSSCHSEYSSDRTFISQELSGTRRRPETATANANPSPSHRSSPEKFRKPARKCKSHEVVSS